MKNPYNHVPLIYQHIMRKIDYEGWAEYINDLLIHFEIQPQRILELAAGDCKVSNFLSDKYQNIIATDISHQMLSMDLLKRTNKVCCDMTKLPFKQTFDLVFSTFDSINYLMSKDEIKKLYEEVSSLLSEEGIFTFDASLEMNSIKHVKSLNRRGKYKDYKYFQKSFYSTKDKIHENTFVLKKRDEPAVTETHKQRVYNLVDFFEAAEETNMYVKECFDFFSFESAHENCERVQFIMMRRK